jgi:oligoribonuclease
VTLAFTDLETTGLDTASDDVLEVGCIVTDDRLVEIARYHAVVRAEREFYDLPEIVRDMHTQSGLWAEATGPEAQPIGVVDLQLAAFLREHAVQLVDRGDRNCLVRPQLAGSGIHFDRAIMRRCLRRAEAELHYRQLDITSINELVRRFRPQLHEDRPRLAVSAHRAITDAAESLDVARYYARFVEGPKW